MKLMPHKHWYLKQNIRVDGHTHSRVNGACLGRVRMGLGQTGGARHQHIRGDNAWIPLSHNPPHLLHHSGNGFLVAAAGCMSPHRRKDNNSQNIQNKIGSHHPTSKGKNTQYLGWHHHTGTVPTQQAWENPHHWRKKKRKKAVWW